MTQAVSSMNLSGSNSASSAATASDGKRQEQVGKVGWTRQGSSPSAAYPSDSHTHHLPG